MCYQNFDLVRNKLSETMWKYRLSVRDTSDSEGTNSHKKKPICKSRKHFFLNAWNFSTRRKYLHRKSWRPPPCFQCGARCHGCRWHRMKHLETDALYNPILHTAPAPRHMRTIKFRCRASEHKLNWLLCYWPVRGWVLEKAVLFSLIQLNSSSPSHAHVARCTSDISKNILLCSFMYISVTLDHSQVHVKISREVGTSMLSLAGLLLLLKEWKQATKKTNGAQVARQQWRFITKLDSGESFPRLRLLCWVKRTCDSIYFRSFHVNYVASSDAVEVFNSF